MYNTNEGQKISFNKIKDYMLQFSSTDIFQLLDGSSKADRKIV
jgi:hypothetical protein